MRTNTIFLKISIILLVSMLVLGVNNTLSANQKKVDKAPDENKITAEKDSVAIEKDAVEEESWKRTKENKKMIPHTGMTWRYSVRFTETTRMRLGISIKSLSWNLKIAELIFIVVCHTVRLVSTKKACLP